MLLWAFATAAAACGGPATPSTQPHGPLHPPPKPGESITRTLMCSCTACEPTSCCRELEQDQPPAETCSDGYDFSKCGLSVPSCDSRCYQHRWRTRVETGCEEKRPAVCCHATADF